MEKVLGLNRIRKRRLHNPLVKLLRWYFSKNALPYWCIFALDGIILLGSGIFSYWIFNEHHGVIEHFIPLMNTLIVYLLTNIIGVRTFHTYAGIVRYSSFVDLLKVCYANLLSFALVWGLHYLIYEMPEDVMLHFRTREIVLMFIISTSLMWAVRILVKALYDVSAYDKRASRALIYGAMNGGVGLAKNIRNQRPVKYIIKGFISHDARLKHNRLMGERVYSQYDDIAWIAEKNRIEVLLVASNRVDEIRQNQKLLDDLIDVGVKIFLAQGAAEMNSEADNQQMMSDLKLKEVSVEDLLPRNEIKVDMESVGELLTNKRIMITGAAGSIGSEMVRQIASYQPEAMLLIDSAETPEHDVRLMMASEFPNVETKTVVANICQMAHMEKLFRDFRPNYVFHAAAYKHVPMMEDNPCEAVFNNIYGTKVIADLSVKYGVRKFVMVSTDKAVNPTNVMGCSKRICEIYVQSLDRELKFRELDDVRKAKKAKSSKKNVYTQFVTTRFGNVLGSNGSVIPLFREQIRKGGPVTVTDERIVRYFMLIPEACKLVLEAGTKGNGGEIFIFDMGQPVRIADLAERMIKLSGAKNVEIQYTGLREGEKLYEEMLNDKEKTKPTFHEKIRIAKVREYDFDQVSKDIDELIAISKQYDDMATVKKMKEIVPEYKSENSPKYEALDKK
ncbi:NDP-sugar epimerase, includes UDP-GlcNAc-inverting 4,6-dehydratase FlaA1 and capsular polysaccharide biosynthesis protein EpsC [Prevotella sp. ne3005]|uniref:polysaccharide biosynthesis protein n=1 Tax=Prevotella sp. ne3005 TaxID=1761887 RepID=UPI0008D800FC|nr:nucleoside-diphosphate sugar epimerase/dehydratase [Prevotella sp. ne3005]SEM52658.1 NDP-sugar epimerase, includes UDP-GlcNAc-inverting 4,6-dehydratase FlaA1 and capsular polysaccharide biosynthesis protein EpsC [Prevotella sp. ne3005]